MVEDVNTDSNQENIPRSSSRITIPVVVIIDRIIDRSSKWALPGWHVSSIVTGDDANVSEHRVTEHENGRITRYYWSGLKLDIYKDGSEGYWYNLLSQTPYLFVICSGEAGDSQIRPIYVTANQDEANGHLESDDLVLSIAMPASIREMLEHYVIAHYRPVKKKKRKRKDWLEDSQYAKKNPN